MIFLISVSTSFRERTKQQNCWICRHFAPDNIPSRIWRTASYHWARVSPLTLAKSWSRLSARSVLQNACGLLRSPLATRTSALLLRASCPEGQLVRFFRWSFWPVDIECAVLPAWISCPLPAAFSGSPSWGSSPCIPCRRSFNFQGAVLDLAIKNRHTTTWTWPSLPGWPWFGFVM